MTWKEVVKLEPNLQKLLDEAKATRDDGEGSFCANFVWYRHLKPRLMGMVGWERVDPPDELRSCDAYDVAYQTIYDALPNCRNCGCA